MARARPARGVGVGLRSRRLRRVVGAGGPGRLRQPPAPVPAASRRRDRQALGVRGATAHDRAPARRSRGASAVRAARRDRAPAAGIDRLVGQPARASAHRRRADTDSKADRPVCGLDRAQLGRPGAGRAALHRGLVSAHARRDRPCGGGGRARGRRLVGRGARRLGSAARRGLADLPRGEPPRVGRRQLDVGGVLGRAPRVPLRPWRTHRARPTAGGRARARRRRPLAQAVRGRLGGVRRGGRGRRRGADPRAAG